MNFDGKESRRCDWTGLFLFLDDRNVYLSKGCVSNAEENFKDAS